MKPPNDRGRIPRWLALVIGAVIVLSILVDACGTFFVDVVIDDAVDGAVLLAWMLAGFGYGALVERKLSNVVNRRSTIDLQQSNFADPLLGFVTSTALGLGIIGLLALGVGLAGFLTQSTSIAVIVVGLIGAGFVARNGSPAAIKRWLATRTSPAAVLIAAPLAIVIVAASIAPGFLWKPLDPHPYDVLSYHLQIAREWYDAGKIVPLTHNSFSFFPMGMEMHDLLAMHLLGGPWKAMYLCQFMSVAFGSLTVLAVVGGVRTLGGSSTLAWLAGLATACVPWTTMLSSVAYVEPGVMCFTVLAVIHAARAFSAPSRLEGGGGGRRIDDDGALRSSTPPTPPSPSWGEGVRSIPSLTPHASPLTPFLLASAFAAFACGMKYTAFPMTAAPVLLLFPIFARKHSIKPWLIGCVACLVLISPWLIRNLFWTHNPVFPLAANIFGHAHFTPDQVDRYLTAHAPPIAERSIGMRLFNAWHRVALDPQFGYLLLPMTIVAMALSWRSLRLRYITAVAIAMALVWLLATHDMPRFLAPAVPLAVLIIAGAAARHGRVGIWIGGGLLLIQSVIGLAWTWLILSTTGPQRDMTWLQMGQAGAFRMADMSVIETDETKAARTSGDRVALIGDAQAFFYVMPSDKLLYRGVFDVNIPPGVTTTDGWLGKSVDQLRHEGYWVVINTSELNRLSQTYAHIPKPAPPFDVVQAAPIVLPPIR